MILADTSIWIYHLRFGNHAFAEMLERGDILMHPFVLGELALGSVKDRVKFLAQLHRMEKAVPARDVEVLQLIENRRIYSSGIGYADAHLLASVSLMPGTVLWTRDKRLHSVAENMDLAFRQANH